MSLDQSEYETLAAFRHALRQFLHFSEQAAEAVGLTPQQHQALLAVQGFPGGQGPSVGQLAERLQIRPHSAVGLVDRLIVRRLLRRQPSLEDRRQVRLALTPAGLALLEKLSLTHREELRRIGPHLDQLLRDLGGE